MSIASPALVRPPPSLLHTLPLGPARPSLAPQPYHEDELGPKAIAAIVAISVCSFLGVALIVGLAAYLWWRHKDSHR